MDSPTITLQDAIKQVDEWLAEADKACTLHSGGGIGNTYYTINLSRWSTLKEVAELLSKVTETDDEYQKHDTE